MRVTATNIVTTASIAIVKTHTTDIILINRHIVILLESYSNYIVIDL